ncbi:hypothetical protein WA026_002197 [Henosepilachna vigintioctopunctata]
MDCMDIDDDLEPNPIKEFLKNKLEEIRNENSKLQETLNDLKEQIENASREIEDSSDDIVIKNSWTKIVHNKYAIWFSIENRTGRCLKDCQLILRWNAPSSFHYTSSMYIFLETCSKFNQSFERVNSVDKKSYIVAVLDRPDFVKQRSVEISGVLRCILEGDEIFVNVPDMTIMAEDTTDMNKIISSNKLFESNIPNFISCLVCSEKINLIQKHSEPSCDISSNLERDAHLHKCTFDEYNGRSFFIAQAISPIFDGCIIELRKKDSSDISRIGIYYRCQESLLAFVHYLFQKIKFLILLPEEYEIYLHSQTLDECEQVLKKCILKEIDFAKNVTSRPDMNTTTLKEAKIEICSIENETDEAFVRLCVAENRIEDLKALEC